MKLGMSAVCNALTRKNIFVPFCVYIFRLDQSPRTTDSAYKRHISFSKKDELYYSITFMLNTFYICTCPMHNHKSHIKTAQLKSGQFSQFVVIHTIKGFSAVSEGEVDFFPGISCFFYDPVDVCNLISGSFAFSKSTLYIWNLSVHSLLKPSLKDKFAKVLK